MKNILIGGAWPYANGSLHIGHIAALLPGDVLARYYRARGEQVFYVSGSDCHGTPITVRAKQEGKTPQEICDYYHREFCVVFQKLGFSYDLYTKTTDEFHVRYTRDFHRRLYDSGYVSERSERQAYCTTCRKILTDRLIIGRCPVCSSATRGEQCEACGELLEADTVVDARCAECGSSLSYNETTQLFLELSKLESELKAYFEAHQGWRKNAVAFTKRYIDEGLRIRAISRDLDWGIDVPKKGYENKKIYIWAENVLGYLSAGKRLCEARGIPFEKLFGANARHYYVHGKDNIPFHTIILPALLMAYDSRLHLPDDIISSEYMTLDGRKISTSQNWAVWAKDIIDRYNPDTIRYFFIANGPEKRDTDLSWREFAERNNTELIGAWGNLVNRTLVFITKYFGGAIPAGIKNETIDNRICLAFNLVGSKIEEGRLKEALDDVFDLVRFGNRYYDSEAPWKTRTDDPSACAATLFNCVQLIANLSVLLAPFLPFSSNKLIGWLGLSAEWREQSVSAGFVLHETTVLFERIDEKTVEAETSKLHL